MVIMTDRSNMADLEEEFEFESSIDNDKNIEKLLQIICWSFHYSTFPHPISEGGEGSPGNVCKS